MRLMREIAQNFKSNLKFQKDAMRILQKAAKTMLINFFESKQFNFFCIVLHDIIFFFEIN